MDDLPVKPLNGRVVVEVFDEKEAYTEKHGLHLPDTDRDLVPVQRGIVLRTADDVKGILEGDRVYFQRYGGSEIEEGVIVMFAMDIMAVREDGEPWEDLE